ncbi:hypothetical protein D3C81_1634250 [compost metagenome]
MCCEEAEPANASPSPFPANGLSLYSSAHNDNPKELSSCVSAHPTWPSPPWPPCSPSTLPGPMRFRSRSQPTSQPRSRPSQKTLKKTPATNWSQPTAPLGSSTHRSRTAHRSKCSSPLTTAPRRSLKKKRKSSLGRASPTPSAPWPCGRPRKATLTPRVRC